MRSQLSEAAVVFARAPSDVDSMAAFIERLSAESDPSEIEKILAVDFENVAGHALRRLVELLPENGELLLSLALWNYHFGMDEEALQCVQRAKDLSPNSLSVLQTEIYLNYGAPVEFLASLVRDALQAFPDDEWLQKVFHTLEQDGKLTEMSGPPLDSRWQNLIAGGTS